MGRAWEQGCVDDMSKYADILLLSHKLAVYHKNDAKNKNWFCTVIQLELEGIKCTLMQAYDTRVSARKS